MINILACIAQYVYIAGNNTFNQLGTPKKGYISSPEYFLYPFNITHIESNGESTVFYSSLQKTIYTSGISTPQDGILFSRENIKEIQFARRFLFNRNNYQIKQMTMTNTTTYVILSNNLIVKSVANGDMQPLNFNADNTAGNFTICGTDSHLWMLNQNGSIYKLNDSDKFNQMTFSMTGTDQIVQSIQCYDDVVILSVSNKSQSNQSHTIYAIKDTPSTVSICGTSINNTTFTKLHDMIIDQYIGEKSQLFLQYESNGSTSVKYCGINVVNNTNSSSLTTLVNTNQTEQVVSIAVQATAWYILLSNGQMYLGGIPNNDQQFKYTWEETQSNVSGLKKYILSYQEDPNQLDFNRITVRDDLFIIYHNNTKNYFHNYPEGNSLVQIFLNIFVALVIIGYMDILIRWMTKKNTMIDINLQILTYAVEERKKQIEEEEQQAQTNNLTVEIDPQAANIQAEETSNLNAGQDSARPEGQK